MIRASWFVGLVAVSLGLVLPVNAQSAGSAPAPELAAPSCDHGAAHPSAPAELAQFDFLIGDYTIAAHAWRGGAWTPPRPGSPARWNGYYALGGMAIADEWYDVDPGHAPETPRGMNVRRWDAEAGEWDMMWLHSIGSQVTDLRARMIDDKLTMWQIYPEGSKIRSYFERLGPDNWHRITQSKNDSGEWQPTFKLVATRIPCSGK